MIALWALAIASVAAWAVVRVTMPEPAPQPAVTVEAPGLELTDGELPVLFSTPEFDLTDQNGEAFSSEELEGKVWVGFIFLTNCPTGACPVMTGKMADLQEALPDERVHFVSFSIDPERDTPEVLKAYAESASEGEVSPRWHLLTGASRQEMHELANAMKLTFDDENQHSTWFLLVDGQGNVRGLYGNTDPEGMKNLRRDAETLLAETD